MNPNAAGSTGIPVDRAFLVVAFGVLVAMGMAAGLILAAVR